MSYKRRREATRSDRPALFHLNGRPILAYLDGWRAACKRAAVRKRGGLETVVRPRLLGRIPHDFRRTAAGNFIRAGVGQHVVLQLCVLGDTETAT